MRAPRRRPPCFRLTGTPKPFGLALGACAIALALSCKLPVNESPPEVLAEFGIFYGGQVQEREQVPFHVDSTRQTQGFRLQLPSPPRQPIEVRWELGMPGSGQRVMDSQGRRARPRKAKLGQARWRPDETVFEQVVPFNPGDPLGLWNIRVLVGSRVVLDRPFLVYDPEERARHLRERQERDGGL
jgi:hypothetical protein